MSKLYHYVHFPFCVRIRMAAGFLKTPYESIVLAYDDEKTPIDLIQKKMLPIFEFKNGNVSNESLEIIKCLDKDNKLFNYKRDQGKLDDFNQYLNTLGSPVHSLTMPYFIYTPEFNDSSRKYFLKKKEQKRGPFHLLVQKQNQLIEKVNRELSILENNLDPFYDSDKLTLIDVLLASHLWGLYIVPEFQFTEKWHSYLQKVKSLTKFNYHEDFWNKPIS